MDDWQATERYAGNPAASGVQIAESVADEFAVMRFAELLKLGEASITIERALSKWTGNSGCAALEQLAKHMQRICARDSV